MNRQLFSLLLGVALCINSLSAQNNKAIELTFKDGTMTYFAFENQPKIEFSETEFIMSTDEVKMNLPLNTIAKYSFNENTNGLRNTSAEERIIRYSSNTIICQGFEGNNSLFIHDMGGIPVLSVPITENIVEVDISSLQKGIYIASIQNVTLKIYLK